VICFLLRFQCAGKGPICCSVLPCGVVCCSVLQFGLRVTDIAASVLARMGGGVAGVLQCVASVSHCVPM